MGIPVEVWENIARYIAPNPLTFCRLALVCRSAYIVFTSTPHWRCFGHADTYGKYMEFIGQLTGDEQLVFRWLWEDVATLQSGGVINAAKYYNPRLIMVLPQVFGPTEMTSFELGIPSCIVTATPEVRFLFKPCELLSSREFIEMAVQCFGNVLALSPFLDDRTLVEKAVETWPPVIIPAREFAGDVDLYLRASRGPYRWLIEHADPDIYYILKNNLYT